jgi:2-polyprenyl-6-methoxyphenol hydroxylase-like FAD-dependent oxidoreductase
MLLMQAAEKCNAKIIFDTKLKEIDIERVSTICKGDRDFSADVIIGADGMPLVFATVRKIMTKLHRYRLNDEETHWSDLWRSYQRMA